MSDAARVIGTAAAVLSAVVALLTYLDAKKPQTESQPVYVPSQATVTNSPRTNTPRHEPPRSQTFAVELPRTKSNDCTVGERMPPNTFCVEVDNSLPTGTVPCDDPAPN